MHIADAMPREFTFGPDLQLVAANTPGDPAAYRLDAAAEEGLETLLMLNLEHAFPEHALRLRGTSDDGWGAADILAVDPLGALHVFELKYAAKVDSSLIQAVAYALSQTYVPDWRTYVTQHRALTQEFVARRIAGVWTQTRSDMISVTQKKVPERDKDRARLHTLVGEDAGEAMARAKDALDRLAQRRGPLPGIHLQPAVHLHVVVPTGSLDDALMKNAVELAKRNVRLNLWGAELAFDKDTRSGRLRLSPIPIEYSPKKGVTYQVNWVAPQALRGAIEASPALGRLRWNMGAGWASWTGAEGRVVVALHLDEGAPKVKLMLQTPTVVKTHHGANSAWSEQYQAERKMLGDHLMPNFLATDGAAHERLNTRSSVTYESRLTGGQPVEIWRSGSHNVSAEIRLLGDVEGPKAAGALLARTLRDAIDFMQSKHLAGELVPYVADGQPVEQWLMHDPAADPEADSDAATEAED